MRIVMRSALALMLITSTTLAWSAPQDDQQPCPGAEGGTLFEACKLRHHIDKTDRKISGTYERIKRQLDKRGDTEMRQSLVDAQEEWLSYRVKTCSFEDQVYGGAYSISELRCMSRLVDERLNYLNQFVGK